MQKIHIKLTSKYPQYNSWHQTKHHNTIHWGVLAIFTLFIFSLIINPLEINFSPTRSNPLSNIQLKQTQAVNPMDNLKPGEWYEVPNSHLRDVEKKPQEYSDYNPSTGRSAAYDKIRSVEGVSAVIVDWSSGAYDSKRDRLIVWGGGHAGYAGNEIYVFDLNTLKWERVNDPSSPPGEDVPFALDGGPTSRHTYNYIQYVPNIDRFCSFGGGGLYKSGSTGTEHTDCFNFETLKWEQMADTPSSRIGAFSAVDPVTGHVWVRGNVRNTNFSEFDPLNNIWTVRNRNESDLYLYRTTAAIDPVRRKFVSVGEGNVYSWDIGASGIITRQSLTTTGASEIVNAWNPGFEYDPVSDKFVAWNGGADVYTLDMETLVWTRHAPAPTNTIIPTAAAGRGTYGRFRYSPSKNAFVVVNSVDQNVYIYKLNPGGGTPGDTTLPATPTNLTATPISSSQINLTWTASTDNIGVTGYKIYRCAGSGCAPTTQIATSPVNSYSNTGLTASTAYTYAVSAYDAAGNESGKSSSVSATTLSQFKQADFNKDGIVNQLDFDILKQEWTRTDKPSSDLNQDGIVDSRDLGIMMSEWTR